MNYGVKTRGTNDSSNGDSKNINLAYYKFIEENPSTSELLPSFVPSAKIDGNYQDDWTAAVEQVDGEIVGLTTRTYEWKKRGQSGTGLEASLYIRFDDENYACLKFGKSGVLNALLNAIFTGNLVAKPVSLFLWAKDEQYSNVSIKHVGAEGTKRPTWDKVEMSMSFREFIDAMPKDSVEAAAYISEKVNPMFAEIGFNPEDPFKSLVRMANADFSGATPASAKAEPSTEFPSVEESGGDDLPF